MERGSQQRPEERSGCTTLPVCEVKKDMWVRALWVALLSALIGPPAWAQSNVPVISGGAGFLGGSEGGVTFFQPVVAPVLTVPLGEKWLIESRADLRGVIFREQGTTGPFRGRFFGTLEYLQLDYNATSRLTITAGRFLTPFGIFNERVSPIWINKLQDPPLIAAIGTQAGYSNGFMVRGAVVSRSNYAVNYTAYFSTLSSVDNLRSRRSVGGRAGVFFPRTRLELGTSFGRSLQDVRRNSVGLDVSWTPYQVPLDIKGEWAHSPSGHGFWLQTAYRLSHFRGPDSKLGRLEPVFRTDQFWRSQPIPGDFLPGADRRRLNFGLNYYLPHEVRLNASYSRNLVAHATDVNVWRFGITYRFLLPLWPGGTK